MGDRIEPPMLRKSVETKSRTEISIGDPRTSCVTIKRETHKKTCEYGTPNGLIKRIFAFCKFASRSTVFKLAVAVKKCLTPNKDLITWTEPSIHYAARSI
jgi:hypothetical protein